MLKIKFSEFLNSYIYLNLKNNNLNKNIFKKNNINFYYLFDINNICNKLSILYLFIYYITLFNKNLIIINFNYKINSLVKEVINLTGFFNIKKKYIKILNNLNIKNEILLYYWFNYIYINIIENIFNFKLKNFFYKNFLKINKKKILFKLFNKKNYFILINNKNNINNIKNKYIINISSNKTLINNNYLDISINDNILSFTYLFKIIVLSNLKSKFNKYKIL